MGLQAGLDLKPWPMLFAGISGDSSTQGTVSLIFLVI